MPKTNLTYVQRLERRTKKQRKKDGCWLWTGANSPRSGGKGKPRDQKNRYGLMGYEGRLRPTHVIAYLELVGPIPDGYDVHHICEVTLCWRPDHLRAVTRRENLMASDTPARRNAEKTHCKRGHEFTPENTRLKSIRGGRSIVRACKACERDLGREFKRRNADRINARRRELAAQKRGNP